ncbi:hypothetical protein [Roseateles violae]|uniref:Uncharacterized protein n=1 Tax=Roseateles violae TaxID=3058042 RepID=A0ABT8DXC5_9BURK|nr:hypothetical protein [Pelomonas sp. PFR6]MDN3922020.1 hypothetical protein [Pelomonas sp. PFR6]
MQAHKPAAHAFTASLQRILQRTEALLQRRPNGPTFAETPADDDSDMLAGLEVCDSDWGAWVEAGGDLLMGKNG